MSCSVMCFRYIDFPLIMEKSNENMCDDLIDIRRYRTRNTRFSFRSIKSYAENFRFWRLFRFLCLSFWAGVCVMNYLKIVFYTRFYCFEWFVCKCG